MKKNPLISVIMPVYNSEKYLSLAIESVLNQTIKDLEFLIIDDCSTDSSVEIIKKFMKKDKRIKLFKTNENSGGCTKPINVGLKNAKGKFIARMDADDLSNKNRFELQLESLKESKADISSTNLDFIDEKGKVFLKRKYDLSDFSNLIQIESPIAHGTILAKKSVFDKYGLFDEKFKTSQDYDMWLRLWSRGVKFILCDRILYSYRQHSKTGKTLKTKNTIKNVLKIKFKAMKIYNIKFSFKAWIRIFIEIILFIIPSFFVRKLFFIYVKFNKNG